MDHVYITLISFFGIGLGIVLFVIGLIINSQSWVSILLIILGSLIILVSLAVFVYHALYGYLYDKHITYPNMIYNEDS